MQSGPAGVCMPPLSHAAPSGELAADVHRFLIFLIWVSQESLISPPQPELVLAISNYFHIFFRVIFNDLLSYSELFSVIPKYFEEFQSQPQAAPATGGELCSELLRGISSYCEMFQILIFAKTIYFRLSCGAYFCCKSARLEF